MGAAVCECCVRAPPVPARAVFSLATCNVTLQFLGRCINEKSYSGSPTDCCVGVSVANAACIGYNKTEVGLSIEGPSYTFYSVENLFASGMCMGGGGGGGSYNGGSYNGGSQTGSGCYSSQTAYGVYSYVCYPRSHTHARCLAFTSCNALLGTCRYNGDFVTANGASADFSRFAFVLNGYDYYYVQSSVASQLQPAYQCGTVPIY